MYVKTSLVRFWRNTLLKNLHNFFFVEIKVRSKKWLLSCLYNPNANLIADYLNCIGRGINFYTSKYDNFIVLGDLNTEVSNSCLEQFCTSYSLKVSLKEPTCFEIVNNLSCINLVKKIIRSAFKTLMFIKLVYPTSIN